MKLALVKKPNEIDPETIEVVVADGLGKIGYVANSVYTREGTSYSAGRLIDKIEDNVPAVIEYVFDRGAICSVCI